jgi:N-acylneuraminate cytidylyltransferase/CMP-N,N'-diacetyllegionaminic acid synthase
LQPTSPLRLSSDIDNVFNALTEDFKAIVSVCETEHSPLWSNTLPKDLSMKNFIRPEIKNKRSQDLPKYYRLNGAIYISEVDYFIQNNGFFGDKTKAFIMPTERSIDIDTAVDFELCKILMNENNKNNSQA